jgi:predicted DNA-binding transcriptional regulator AlpA
MTGHAIGSGTSAAALPRTLGEVALVDASTCAAVGSMSVSWWWEEVRTGRAPAPAVRAPRCTRWRISDVRAFWEAFARRCPAAGVPSLVAATGGLR